jgi:hypothetical protein
VTAFLVERDMPGSARDVDQACAALIKDLKLRVE